MADRVLKVVNNQVRISVTGGALVAALAGQAAAAAAGPYVEQAVAAAASAEAQYQDMLDIQAMGDDAAAIAARVPKNTDGSDFTQPDAVRSAIGADLSSNVMFAPAFTGSDTVDLQTLLRAQALNAKTAFGLVGDAVQDPVTLLWSGTDNHAGLQAALYAGASAVYLPAGNYLISDTVGFGTQMTFFGDGEATRIIFNAASNSNWFNLINCQDCTVRDMWIDGNRNHRAGGFVATGGGNITIANLERTFFPRFNNIRIRNVKSTDSGFIGIYLDNAHGVWVDGCTVTGDSDSAVAACTGSSRFFITRNYCEGYSFGVSCSSDGNPWVADTGLVRDFIVAANQVVNNKAGGYGYQFDGISDFTIADNYVVMQGGAYGYRFYNSAGLGLAGEVDCNRGAFTGNRANVKTNVPSACLEVAGAGDITDVLFSNFIASASAPSTSVIGVSFTGGVVMKVSDVYLGSLGQAVYIDTNDIASTLELRDFTLRLNSVGVEAAAAQALKTTLILDRFDCTGGVIANLSIGSAYDLVLRNTPVLATSYMTENSRYGQGDPRQGTAAPSTNADFVGQIFVDKTTPKAYVAKAIGTGGSDWMALN